MIDSQRSIDHLEEELVDVEEHIKISLYYIRECSASMQTASDPADWRYFKDQHVEWNAQHRKVCERRREILEELGR